MCLRLAVSSIALRGDDFTSSTLDPSWAFADVVDNSTYSLTASPQRLQVNVPAGSDHDCWNTTLNCTRMLRSVNNMDAIYETKIDGVNIGAQFQACGIFLQQDNGNFMRFELWTSGSAVRVAAWRSIGGIGPSAIYGPNHPGILE
jgi:Beta xylosidase C-terminal Concanavalin A-like domain